MKAQLYYFDKYTNEKKPTYTAWNCNLKIITRANQPNKFLQKSARELATKYINGLKKSKSGQIFITHEYISSVSETGEKQNARLHEQLADIFNITYHQTVFHEGRIKRNGFIIFYQENGEEILNNTELFFHETTEQNVGRYRQKCRQVPTKMSAGTPLKPAEVLEFQRPLNNNKNIKDIDILDILETRKNEILEFEEPELSKFYNNSIEEKVLPVASITPIKIPLDKTLMDYLPVTKEQVGKLNSRSGREFDVNFTNELVKKLGKKYPHRRFTDRNQFLAYMTKAFLNEKHQGPVVNNPNFRLSANLTQEDKDNRNMEKQLANIESSQEISKNFQLQKKIAGVFDAVSALEILENYEFHHDEEKNAMKIMRKNNFTQTEHAKEKLRNEIKAVYGSDIKITLEMPTRIYTNDVACKPQIVKLTEIPTLDYIKPVSNREPTLWEKVLLELRCYISPTEERSWFSRISITEEDGKIIFKGGSDAEHGYIKTTFDIVLNKSFNAHGYQLEKFWRNNKAGIVFEPIGEKS